MTAAITAIAKVISLAADGCRALAGWIYDLRIKKQVKEEIQLKADVRAAETEVIMVKQDIKTQEQVHDIKDSSPEEQLKLLHDRFSRPTF